MYHQPINEPMALMFRSTEDRRIFDERLRNIGRLIAYNNKRVLAGLPLVRYPRSLIDWDQIPFDHCLAMSGEINPTPRGK